MEQLSDEQILKSLTDRLEMYLQKEIEIKAAISKVKAAIDAFSISNTIDGKSSTVSFRKSEQPKVDLSGVKWIERVIMALKNRNKVMTTRQIVNWIIENNGSTAPNGITVREEIIFKLVAGILHTLTSRCTVKKWKPENEKMKGYFYGSPTWFDEQSNLSDLYKPEIKEIVW